ncbi:MAG: crossover junction endodeoxyribonuclease RuvC [bacterium]|nr:crossover junction endodeoxyribonuclease RuvC [bacterium]
MKILGIDPGTSRIGYGLVNDRPLTLINYGVLEITDKGNDKLLVLASGLEKLILDAKPDLAAVEKIFFSTNRKTAIDVAQARGVILYCLLKHKIAIREYGPQEVKMAVTSYGLADKKAVAKMVTKLLNVQEISGHDDASDALAIAITAANMNRL